MAQKSKKDMDVEKGSQKAGGTIGKILNKVFPKDKPQPPVKPPVKKEPKRGHYKQKECPYCHKYVGNLGNHVKLKHPLEHPPEYLTKERLLDKKRTPQNEGVTYACLQCHAEIRKGETSCWNCGKFLNWEGIE